MPGRQYNATTGYRYGFNGKEKDTESPVQYDYGFRIYDPRLMRFKSVDPLSKDYPSWSPYPFAMNRPIDGIDLDGLEYLNASISKIDIYISPFSYNGRTVLTGNVQLDLNNISPTTKFYITSKNWKEGEIGSPAGVVAKFEHKDYQELVQQSINALSSMLKQPTMEDAKAESLQQPELTVIKNKKIPRILKPKSQQNNKTPNRSAKRGSGSSSNISKSEIPSGVASGTVKGDAIIAMVSLTGEILSIMGNNRISKDYRIAESQIGSVGKVLNDVQFAVDNKYISENLSEFANYLLDGRVPTMLSTFTDKNGVTTTNEVTNSALLKKFEEVSNKIEQRRKELEKCSICESKIK